MCADDCRTAEFLDWLDEPFTAHEIAASERRRQRTEALMRGEIPA